MMPFIEMLTSLDKTLFLFLNAAFAHPVLDVVFKNGTEASFWIIPGIIAAVLFIVRKKKEALLVLGLGIIIVAITDPLSARVLKPLFGRHRPCHPDMFVEGGRFLCGMRHSLSFPSVHAVNIFAQATMLAMFYPRWKWIYFSFACFIGYSRIYVGVHYPGDVLFGAVVGTIIALLVVYTYRFVKGKIRMRQSRQNDILKSSAPT
jgi:undecaprenyl-diphosphatase